MRIDLSKIKLQLKVVKPTKKVVPKEIPPKKLTKLINGKVVLKDGIYSCVISYDEFANRMFGNIDVKEITDNTQSIEIPFTVESFDIKSFKTIFTRNKSNFGYLSVVRTESQAIFGNWSPDVYVPFAPNWIVRGWIVKINDKLQFKFRNLVTIAGHNYNYRGLLDDDEFEWFNNNFKNKK